VARELVRRRVIRLVELAALGDTPRCPSREGHEVIDVRDVPVRIGRSLAAGDADTRALVDAGDRVLDAPVVEDQLKRLVTLPEKLSPIAASRERGAQRLGCLASADRRLARDCCCDDRPPLP
jgi:hypothetical protein